MAKIYQKKTKHIVKEKIMIFWRNMWCKMNPRCPTDAARGHSPSQDLAKKDKIIFLQILF